MTMIIGPEDFSSNYESVSNSSDSSNESGDTSANEQAQEKAREKAREKAANRAKAMNAHNAHVQKIKKQDNDLYDILINFIKSEDDDDMITLIVNIMRAPINTPSIILLGIVSLIMTKKEDEAHPEDFIENSNLLDQSKGLQVFNEYIADENVRLEIIKWINQIKNSVLMTDYRDFYTCIKDQNNNINPGHTELIVYIFRKYLNKHNIKEPNRNMFDFFSQIWISICNERGKLESEKQLLK